MEIRIATAADLPRILEIYAAARAFMAANGNPSQWGNDRPYTSDLEKDIEDGVLYVCLADGVPEGVFALIPGTDPTYQYIEDGQWGDDREYAAVHKVASSGRAGGVFRTATEYALSKHGSIRMDTHKNNLIMQHLFDKNGFTRCGIIYLADGDSRIAYRKDRD